MLQPILIFLAIVAVLVGLGVVAQRAAKKRTENLRREALKLGLTLQETMSLSEIVQDSTFNLFQRGRFGSVKNVLLGKIDSCEVRAFDYEFVTGSGKHRKTHRQTVMIISHEKINLPQFALRPEGMFDKVASLVGFKDINLDHSPEFSKKYRLLGADENAITRTFSQRITQTIEQAQKISIEGNGSKLLVYEARKRVTPEQLSEFVRGKVTLARSFLH